MKLSEILTDESKWTKDQLAKDVHGKAVIWASEDAVCFCLTGACLRSDTRPFQALIPIIRELYPERVGDHHAYCIAHFNDHPDTDWEDIKRVLTALESRNE